MVRVNQVRYVFVDSTPATLEPEMLYISIKYQAIVHLCLCGCGEKILLKLDPDPSKGWSFTFDGRSISIQDSVGNVGIPCRSHYIVRKNRVQWLAPLDMMDAHSALGYQPPVAEDVREPRPRGFRGWFAQHRRRLGKK